MTRGFTLGKKERLKNNLSIQELLKHGRVISRFPIKIFWNLSPDPYQHYPARVAISVPRRRFKRAVDRNLMKRRLREAYRLNKIALYEILEERHQKIQLVILLLSDEFIPYDQLEKGMLEILRLLAKKFS